MPDSVWQIELAELVLVFGTIINYSRNGMNSGLYYIVIFI